MKQYKVLNLYACLGGNRYKWNDVAEQANVDLQVTAVELDEELARLYQERFPNDNVIVADAHQYLLDHYKEFDFIWSSPPCPTHSRFNISMKTKRKMLYPDMKLYEEIIFLDNYFDGKYVVENVIPFYTPLIAAKERNRHLYWTNFNLPNVVSDRKNPDFSRVKDVVGVMSKFHNYDFTKYQGQQSSLKISRNLVDYEAGRTIFEAALNIQRKKDIKQTELF
jgi:DNA (cytosine-5)-methyltransferase 1